jgi:hypothetical protein
MRIRTTLLVAGLSLGFALPAVAFQCPADMRKIDEALAANPQLTVEQLAEVQRLRAEGEQLHGAGNHADSMQALAQAMEILDIN